MELNVCFLRHGETLLNELKKNQGWIDSDLTDTGKKLLKKTYKQKNYPNLMLFIVVTLIELWKL